MSDPDAVELYRSIHRENTARFELTPKYRPLKRFKRYEACRSSYASLYAATDLEPYLPSRVLDSLIAAAKKAWHGGLDVIVVVVSICVAVISLVALFVWGVMALDKKSPPKPLPMGVQQVGYKFIIPAQYSTRATTGSEVDPKGLCDRLPSGSRRTDYKISAGSNGSIIVSCEIDD